MKNIFILTIFILLFSCKKNNKELKSPIIQNDTIVTKNIRKVSNDTAFNVQIVREGEYIVSVKKQKSRITYEIYERNDGKVVIRRNLGFNWITSDSLFKFNELKVILEHAKNDFKVDSLNYIIYGTLSSSKKNDLVENATKKFIESQNGKTNINTKNYKKIGDLILQSEIVKEIDKALLPYSKNVSKVNVEKAFIKKHDGKSKEMIDCMLVMEIENKK